MIKNQIPTSKEDLSVSAKVCWLVLSAKTYFILWIFFVPFFVVFLILPTDYNIIINTVILGDIPLSNRISIMYGILPLTGSYTYSPLSDILIYLISLSVSLNMVLFIYHLVEHGFTVKETSGGFLGTLIAVVGSGCASCGVAIIAGIFSAFGLSGILTLLPLRGAEFLLIALLFSFMSIYWIANGLRGGMVRGCPVSGDPRVNS